MSSSSSSAPPAAAASSSASATGSKKRLADPSPASRSRGRPGMHTFTASSTQFVIDSRYVPKSTLGSGAYGVVISATDKTSGEKVAIKKITRAFDDLIDGKRILRELKLLRHFKHENVIGLLDMVDPDSLSRFEDVYLVMEYMETDLHKIINSKNKLTDEHIQFFVYQILAGLKHIHAAGVIHRDLKPPNLLLNSDCELKICDFGLARGVNDSGTTGSEAYELTEYVVTRWYRAPEIMCSCQDYDYKIDVWAVGCILAELLLREPLFPGDDYIHQMTLIFDVLGTPTREDMAFVSNENAVHYIESLKKKKPRDLHKLFPGANKLAVDLLSKMLVFNPHKRISVDEALAHPYLAELVDDLDNHKVEAKDKFGFEFEAIHMTKPILRQLMLGEVAKFRADAPAVLELSRLSTEAELIAESVRRRRERRIQKEKQRKEEEEAASARRSAGTAGTASASAGRAGGSSMEGGGAVGVGVGEGGR